MLRTSVVRTVAPTLEPVTLAEVKRQLRLAGAGFDTTDFDLELQDYIREAREEAEERQASALVTQTWELRLDRLPGDEIRVPRPPLQSVSSITYIDTDGTSQTLSASLYTVDAKLIPARIQRAYLATWPTTRGHINDVTVTFLAGYGGDGATAAESVAAVPKRIKSAIKLMVQQKLEGFDQKRGQAIDNLLALDSYRTASA